MTKNNHNLRALYSAVAVTAAVLVVDQASKAVVERVWPAGLHYNSAVGFSIPLPVWAIVLAAVALVTLLVVEWRSWTVASRPRRAWVIGLVIGGAGSNLVDRALYGAVRDFISISVWPVFNLADVALTVGAIGLLWYAVRSSLATSHGRQGDQRNSTS